jgi:dTDP-4-amino-4,6-dideoxygalactose transaminase
MRSSRTGPQFAVLGAPPAFPDVLHVGRPNVGDRNRFLDRLNDMLDRRWLTNDGAYVQEFEARIAAAVGVRHCVATCNGSMALGIAARAAGVRGEVIVPAFTFVATAHALRWIGLEPVICDVDPLTYNLDPEAAERLISSRTAAIMGVHVWGRPCSPEALERLARANDLILLFDAAQAFGCSHRGRMLGAFGDAEVLSFHATKVVTAGEGGAIVTDDDRLADNARHARNFGFVDYDDVTALGTNGKMSELAAALGLSSLEQSAEFIAANRRNHQAYAAALSDVTGVTLMGYDAAEISNYQYVVIEIDETAGLSRDVLMAVLHAEGILARRYFAPGLHRIEPYRSEPTTPRRLPNTDWLCARVLALPTGTAITDEAVGTICDIIRRAVDAGADLERTIGRR